MILAGDVAIANGDRFAFHGFPNEIRGKPWCFNLEGAILPNHAEPPPFGVYNSIECIGQLKEFHFAPFFLANNHIHDVDNGVKETIAFLAAKGLSGYGAGEDIYWAGFPAEVRSGTNRYLLLGFGWQVIGCKVAKGSQAGVNPFEGTYVLNSAKQVLKEKPSSRLVVVIHGNFEFEGYLQPGHRKLSRELIDCGVYAVIFHHPHIVGPIERYKGKLIAHSLGNWAFSYGKHFEGKLRFPKTSFHQIALELDDDKSIVHHSRFDPPNEVNYLFPESVDAFDFTLRPIFEEYDDVEYMRWFKQNRLKRMGLPIYKDANSSVFNSIRDAWVYVRQLVIVIMVHLNMKSHSRRA